MVRRTFLKAISTAPALLAAATADGFAPVFDGKTLKGWTIENGPESAFYVQDGAIVVHENAGFPTWLRSESQYENFEFRGEFYIKGWMDSGIYLHAPEHGRPTWAGLQIKLFHQQEERPASNSMGSVFPLVAPMKVNVRNKGEWNDFRIVMDWPSLRVWTNGELIQDLKIDTIPELKHRLRSGYLGLQSLSYPIRFRNLTVKELPSKDKWQTLYESSSDMDKWFISEGKPLFQPVNRVLWADGTGHLATKEKYRDFEMQLYVRASKEHNSGVLFRTSGEGLKGRHYEIQLHNVEDAHYPTGSLYYFKRAIYPRIEDEQWYPMQLIVQGTNCLVRINGDTVLEYDRLEILDEGSLELQAHRAGHWTEFKHIRVKRL